MNKQEIFNGLWTITKEKHNACKAEAEAMGKNHPTERGALQLKAGIYNVAIAAGLISGIDKATEDIQHFREQLKAFLTANKEVFEYIAPDILEISVDIAKKIIKKEVSTDPQVVMNIILDILKSVSKSEPKILIKVNPAEVQFVKDNMPNAIYELGIEAKVSVVGDESLQAGGCKFETSNGIVDASIDAQTEIIKKALRGI